MKVFAIIRQWWRGYSMYTLGLFAWLFGTLGVAILCVPIAIVGKWRNPGFEIPFAVIGALGGLIAPYILAGGTMRQVLARYCADFDDEAAGND